MKKTITFILTVLCFAVLVSGSSFAKYDKKCVANCSAKDNGCQRQCTQSYYVEMKDCDLKKDKPKADCIDTLNNNYSQCQGGCDNIDNMCIDGCLAKKK